MGPAHLVSSLARPDLSFFSKSSLNQVLDYSQDAVRTAMGSVIRQTQAVSLDWTHPGPNERATAAEFILSVEDRINLDAPYAVSATYNHDKGKFDGFPSHA